VLPLRPDLLRQHLLHRHRAAGRRLLPERHDRLRRVQLLPGRAVVRDGDVLHRDALRVNVLLQRPDLQRDGVLHDAVGRGVGRGLGRVGAEIR